MDRSIIPCLVSCLQSNIRDQQKVKEARILELQEVELKLAEFKQSEALIRERIRESYKMEIPELDDTVENIDMDELRKEVTSIHNSLERIGAINMTAQDEFEREQERHDFLKNQYDDLIESENDFSVSDMQVNLLHILVHYLV